MSPIRRGDVVAVRAPRRASGHEQQGRRFGVVLQSDDAIQLSTVLVAPTSSSAQHATFRPEIDLQGRRTRILVDQLTAVDRSRLGRQTGRLTGSELEETSRALRLLLGLL